MTLLIQELLQELERRWQDVGAPISRHLRPGLPRDVIESRARDAGYVLPDEAVQWWAWHDGAELGGPYSATMIAAGFRFRSLETALGQAREQKQIWLEAAGDDYRRWWRDEWLPLLDTMDGGVIAIDAGGPAPTSSVYYLDSEGGGADRMTAEAGSIGQMVTWWLEAFDAGAMDFDRSSMRWISRPERVPAAIGGTRLV